MLNRFFLTITAGCAFIAASNIVYAQETNQCSLTAGAVFCAGGSKDRAKIFEAMANPASLENFQRLRRQNLVSINFNRRESYRRSLERNHRAMKRHAEKQWRLYKRRKLTNEEYETVRTKYKAGLKTYNAALVLYHETSWYSRIPHN